MSSGVSDTRPCFEGETKLTFPDAGAWSIIKPWLDPAIAFKINFTSGTKGLLQYIEKENLQTSYGGEDPWQYKFVPPTEGENE